jgi:hypothetical protein
VHQLAWVRLMVARHPSIYWLSIAVVAALAGLSAARAMADVDTARRSWGEQTTVWMAAAEIEPGQPISADSRVVPRAVVPAGAVAVAPDEVIARQHIGQGEIVVESDLSASGSVGLIPDGWVSFAVAAPVTHFAVGDHVDVYSADRFIGAGLVIDAGESELMVAIPTAAAPAMSTALLDNTVTLALTLGP